MRPLVWSLEWRIAARRRRLFGLNVAIPLVLVAPVALSSAPAHHAAAVYTVLFVLFGTFGGAIPLVRDAERGLIARLHLTGLPARRLFVERILAHALLDAVQLLPALLLISVAALVSGPDPEPALLATLPVCLVAALVAANVLGACIAALARSIAEGALFAAVASLLALHLGGVFRTPAPESAAAAVERLVPFRYLHEALLAVLGAAPAAAPGPGALVAYAALGAGAALALCWALGHVLLGRLARANAR